jgi:hypothetical protein
MKSDGALGGKVIGEIGVAMAVEQLLRAGYAVAIPIVDEGYDLIAFDGRRYWRVQVKATGSNGRNRGSIRLGCGRDKRGAYCPTQVDAFVAVQIRTKVAMCVPVAAVAGRTSIAFSEYDQWSDFGVLRRIKTQRR